jgi:hypothetical protein
MIRALLGVAMVISLLASSCAKPVTRITVKVGDAKSSYVQLAPCKQDAQDPVVLDDTGYGSTAACPSGDVEIILIKPTQTVDIAPEHVKVVRSADGAPVAINFSIP